MFITIEGIDGTGKTTIIQGIKEYLESVGKKVWVTKEPTEGVFGKMIRNENLKDDSSSIIFDALLFAIDRIDHQKPIHDHLEKGFFVLSDRYKDSSIAYQSAQGVDKKWVKTINEHAVEPDYTFLLDMSPEESLKRRFGETPPEDLEKFENPKFLSHVRKNFLEIASEHPQCVFVIDASQSKEKVLEEVLTILKSLNF